MKKETVQFKIDGLLKLNKVADYLQLVDKKVGLTLKEKDRRLNSRTVCKAHVARLSDTGTHLILKKVCVRRYLFFTRQIEKYAVPIKNISAVRILDKYGKID